MYRKLLSWYKLQQSGLHVQQSRAGVSLGLSAAAFLRDGRCVLVRGASPPHSVPSLYFIGECLNGCRVQWWEYTVEAENGEALMGTHTLRMPCMNFSVFMVHTRTHVHTCTQHTHTHTHTPSSSVFRMLHMHYPRLESCLFHTHSITQTRAQMHVG